MAGIQYCVRCGHELTEEDFREGFCLMCGEPVPDAVPAQAAEQEPGVPEAEEPSSEMQEETAPESVEWVEDGDFVVCPLCQASYYKDEAPAVCERCAEDETNRNRIWVMPHHVLPLFFVHAGSGEEIALTDGLILGRSLTPCLAGDPYVSRRHARIDIGDEGITIADLKSMNGTFLNGRRLAPQEGHLLKAGDSVDLDQQHFEVHSRGDV